jgi:hypothetical protein
LIYLLIVLFCNCNNALAGALLFCVALVGARLRATTKRQSILKYFSRFAVVRAAVGRWLVQVLRTMVRWLVIVNVGCVALASALLRCAQCAAASWSGSTR